MFGDVVGQYTACDGPRVALQKVPPQVHLRAPLGLPVGVSPGQRTPRRELVLLVATVRVQASAKRSK